MPAAGQTIKALVKLPRDPAGCWEWLGATNGEYPVKEYCGRTMPAARWLWLTLFGPLDPGLVVTQTCQNRLCINPAHLAAVHETTVAQDAHSPLVPGDVVDIRHRLDNGYPADRLAVEFGIHVSTVYRIGKRRSWAKPDKRRARA